jgi:hypothetical protein
MFEDDSLVEIFATKHMIKIFLIAGFIVPLSLFSIIFIIDKHDIINDLQGLLKLIVSEVFNA